MILVNRCERNKIHTNISIGYSGMKSVCRVFDPTLKPYLSYTITVRSTRLNTPKLSDYQIKLYQKICELRFDENLIWKQVAEKLNKLGYTSSRGGKNTSSTVCSTYFKIRKHFQRQNIYHPPGLDDVKLIWE